MILIIRGPVTVGLLNEFLELFPAHRLLLSRLLHQKIHRRMDKTTHSMIAVLQNIVRAAADNHTRLCLRQFLDDLRLIIEQVLLRREIPVDFKYA